MPRQILNNEQLKDITQELAAKYSLSILEIQNIISDSISKAYSSKYPIVLEEDGVYLVFEENDNVKFSKMVYSSKKTKVIINNIQDQANKYYLELQKDKIVDFIKNKRPYFHSTYSYSKDGNDYYDLYYDKHRKKIVNSAKAIVQTITIKRTRAYISYKYFEFNGGVVIFKENQLFRNIKNMKLLAKDISVEVFQKIDKKIWIEVKSCSIKKQKIGLHLPYKTTAGIIEYIKMRFKEVFGLDVVLIMDKR